jgi:hypothetical protein
MNKALAILSIMYSILKILVNLIGTWLMLGWNTRRARKSFEAKLMKEGMSKQDAQNLSQFYSKLKDQLSIRNIIRTFISMRNKPNEE